MNLIYKTIKSCIIAFLLVFAISIALAAQETGSPEGGFLALMVGIFLGYLAVYLFNENKTAS